ncbi:gliding motility lipoprotein GldB [Flavobacterium sp. 14A]|uniref:gliding motility lipoprotein GldB n=1 Tax=Flavobacterium sp. 14A TaxID=2735896 RepID=UPI00157036B3|nr:gliding motility lipoprotein GldB [Flavobacterium sp. 14A]NRT11567.1 gliding motility-associated lipoprotein GldB [Flavobacterium sp. 14A]
MKIYIYSLVLCVFFVSCGKKDKIEREINETSVTIKVERFDKIFFETAPENLSEVKKQFPYFFPVGNDDQVWIDKMTNPQWRELYGEVEKKFNDLSPVTTDLTDLVKRMKYYFPETKTPKLVTVISEMDYTNKSIYADSLVIVSLELYLGKEHRFYQFPNYIKANFEPKQIMPDVVNSFANGKIKPQKSKNFITKIVQEGKKLYLKDVLLPSYSDEDKMGYTAEQLKWCQENESYMWRYFIERELLYSDDAKLSSRFIEPAPFSKFYLEIDNESPGRVGAWIGWQIVRSYMNSNESPLQQLLDMDAKELFEKSKYKPKK